MAVPHIPGDPVRQDDAGLGEAAAQASATAPAMRILQVDDVARSVSFYRDVLGFEPREAGPDGSRDAAAELVLGAARIQLVPRDQAVPPRPAVVFLQAADLGRVHAGIRARGGHPSEPARVNWIKYEVFEVRDPDGTAIWFGESFAQPYERSRGGLLEKALPELPCDDVAAAVAYYRDVLGFSINYQQHDLGVMQRDDVAILLVPRRRVGHGAAEFYVRDADAQGSGRAGRTGEPSVGAARLRGARSRWQPPHLRPAVRVTWVGWRRRMSREAIRLTRCQALPYQPACRAALPPLTCDARRPCPRRGRCR